jgi:hypothetical protein
MFSSKYTSLTSLNPTTGASDGQGFPFPLANNAKLAPSKTKKPIGANANHDDSISAIHTIGVVPILKPKVYLGASARMMRVMLSGIVVLFKGIWFV